MQQERIRYIDIYKGIGILLVVLGHTQMIPEYLTIWIYAFHMPLFFVATGFLIGRENLYERDSRDIILGRARSILVPYFWFSLIAVLWDAVGIYFEPEQYNIDGLMEKVWDSVTGYGVSVLWFLPAFFVGTVGYQILRKHLPFGVVFGFVTVISVAVLLINGIPDYVMGKSMTAEIFLLKMVYVLWRGCVGMFFCAVGDALNQFLKSFEERKIHLVITGVSLLIIGSFLAIILSDKSNTMVSLRYLISGNIAIFLIESVCICSGILFLCRWIDICSPLEFIGRYSMIILVTHLDLRVMNIAIKSGNKMFEIFDHDFVKNVTVFVVILVLEFIMICLFDGWLAFMFGKKREIPKKWYLKKKE